MLEQTLHYFLEILSIFDGHLLTLAFIILFLNTLVMVPPSEYSCIFFGYWASQTDVHIGMLILICTIANFLGTIPWFFLGRSKLSYKITDFFEKRSLYNSNKSTFLKRIFERMNRIKSLISRSFNRSEILSLILWRNIPLARSICSFFFGRSGVKIHIFLFFSLLGITIWCGFWSIIGYSSGEIIEAPIILLIALCLPLMLHIFTSNIKS